MAADREPGEGVTGLLLQASGGDRAAADRLVAAVYEDLRTRAAASLRGERTGHTLQTTALVHEAWLRLVDQERVRWNDRGHFFAVAATCMRRVLIDHARARGALKRGGGGEREPLEGLELPAGEPAHEELLALDDALERLARVDARKARVIELRLFAGLSIPETAQALDTSHATVERDLRFARAFLLRELDGGEKA